MEDKRTGTAARAYVGVELLADDAGGEVDGERADEAVVVVGVLTDKIDTAGSHDSGLGNLAELLLVESDSLFAEITTHDGGNKQRKEMDLTFNRKKPPSSDKARCLLAGAVVFGKVANRR